MFRNDPNYKYAMRCFKKKDFTAAEDYFLKTAHQYRDSADIYYYLALCALKLKKYNDAAVYIEQALEEDPTNISYLMCGAYVDLFLEKKSHAIYKYTKVINLGKQKRKVGFILNALKIGRSPELLLKKKINYFLNGQPYGFFPEKSIYALTALVLISAAAYYFIPDLFGPDTQELDDNSIIYTNTSFVRSRKQVKKLEEIYLFEDIKPGSRIYTSQQLVEMFNQMKEAIIDGRINEAIYINNRIMKGDVNQLIKEKFNILAKCIPAPNFKDFENRVPADKLVSSDLYENFYVKFKGIVSSLKKGPDDTVFNFSIMKENKITRTVEVIVHNTILESLHEKDRCEMLGRYRLFHKLKKKMIIEGLVIKKL